MKSNREELFDSLVGMKFKVGDLASIIQNPLYEITRENVKEWIQQRNEVTNELNLILTEVQNLITGGIKCAVNNVRK